MIDGATLIQHLSQGSLDTLQNETVEIIIPPEFKKETVFINARIIDRNYNIRYRREILNNDKITPQMESALDEFERLCLSPVLNRKLELKDNQILILDNKRYLHSRTTIKDKDRHLLRLRFFSEFDKIKNS